MKSHFLKICLVFGFGVVVLVPGLSLAADVPGNLNNADKEVTTTNDSFAYSPQGRRDPFEPLVTKDPVIGEVVKKIRPESLKGPLEKYELKQFRLLAIMVVRGTPHAMVEGPDGKSYTVKVDDYIGMNGGVVKDIQTKIIDVDTNGMRIEKSPDRIVVEESGHDSTTGKEVIDYRYIVM